MKIGGVLTALVTPYASDGALDLAVLARHVDYLRSAGVDGFFACGTTGEGAFLAADEKQRVVGSVLDRVGSDSIVVAAVIQPDTRGAIEEVKRYARLNTPFVAVVAPYYVRVDASEMIAHFLAVADAAECPVLAYDIPGCTANPLTDAVYDVILSHENIVGVKDSSAEFSGFARRVIAQQQKSGAQIDWIQGDDTLDAAAMIIGASGVVSGLSNVMPVPFVRLVEAARRGDIAEALKMQHVINKLHAIIRETGKGVAPIRLALALRGFGTRHLRSANYDLGPEWDDRIRAAIEAAEAVLSNSP